MPLHLCEICHGRSEASQASVALASRRAHMDGLESEVEKLRAAAAVTRAQVKRLIVPAMPPINHDLDYKLIIRTIRVASWFRASILSHQQATWRVVVKLSRFNLLPL